jgi:steroid delta-isomerase
MAASAEQIRDTVERYRSAFSSADKQGYLDCFAPDATVEDPIGSDVCRGSAEIGEFWEGMRGLSPSIELRPVGDTRVAGGEAAFAMQAVVDLGGTAMVVDIIDVMRFDDDGRITAMRAYWDPSEMRPDR